MTVAVRRIEARDELRWRELWDGYTRFYEREPAEALTARAWSRIMDPDNVLCAIVAEDRSGEVVGIANYLTHEEFSSFTPACYLQDLYVDPNCRSAGAGKALIDWLLVEMKVRNWGRLYWNTRETNYRARGLYDKFTPQSGFVRYVIKNSPS